MNAPINLGDVASDRHFVGGEAEIDLEMYLSLDRHTIEIAVRWKTQAG